MLGIFWKKGLANCLSRLVSNCDSPDRFLLNS
jgi:hypothetical protein